ncbi:MAG: FHA domain-containing protein [Verrucomicrobia bacterium]|nr:FHA domain-containing protein [Verrucomicrobiota bacterium]
MVRFVQKSAGQPDALRMLSRPSDALSGSAGSVNGTWLNGQRINQPSQLFDRDQVVIGSHRLTFRFLAGS